MAGALEWWSEAGVDTLVDDLPRDWLAAPALPAPSAVPVPAITPDLLPGDLATFLTWRHGEAAPEAGWRGVSVAASGPADAAVMVLVDCPERDDGDAPLLSKGPAGKLFERMLAAVGLSRDTVHVASVCLRVPPPGRMGAAAEARLGEVARHHVALVAPQRVLLLGNATSRAVLGMDVAQARDGLRTLNHENGQSRVVASFHPRTLLERPAGKAEAWKDLRALVDGMTD